MIVSHLSAKTEKPVMVPGIRRALGRAIAGGFVALLLVSASGCNKTADGPIASQAAPPPAEGSSPPPDKLPKNNLGRNSSGGSPAPSSSPAAGR